MMYTDGMRKARTWGTIITRKNSLGTTYEARYSHNGKRISRNFRDRLSAQSWLSSEKALVDADRAGLQRWTSPTERETASKEKTERTVTLGEWLATWGERWITTKEDGTPTATATRRKRREYLHHIDGSFLDKPIGAVTSADIQKWVNGFTAGPTPRLRAFQTLKAALQDAVDTGVIAKHPMAGMRAPKLPPSRQAQIPPATPKELEAIVANMPEYSRFTIWLAAVFGLRINEVCALSCDDIDLVHRILHIRNAVDPETRQLKDTKNASSTADLHIPDAIVPVLEKQLDGRSVHVPLFLAPHGGYMNDKTLRRQFDKAKVAAGRPDLHFHTLRATSITAATQGGATLTETMRLGRHSDVTTSVLRYQRASNQRLTAISETVARTLLPHKRTREEIEQDLVDARKRVAELEKELAELPGE